MFTLRKIKNAWATFYKKCVVYCHKVIEGFNFRFVLAYIFSPSKAIAFLRSENVIVKRLYLVFGACGEKIYVILLAFLLQKGGQVSSFIIESVLIDIVPR